MKYYLNFLGCLLFSLGSSIAHADDVKPVVTTKYGKLAGETSTIDKRVKVFRGIPFAAPPIGKHRWAPPISPTSWKGIRQATEFSPQCLQQTEGIAGFIQNIYQGMGVPKADWPKIDNVKSSEDCLYLNIWSKKLTDKQPVMVWIHGGGHQTGSGASANYEGTQLGLKGVVLVTVNYRLNVFGYFAHPALSKASDQGVSGNYGLLDNIAALRWVQENIAAFGGDPDNVTIFGESAGGTSVLQLVASPLAKGLFHKAISQSGTLHQMSHVSNNAQGWEPSMESRGEQLAKKLSLENPTTEALRALPAEQVVEASTDLSFQPTIDGWSLPVPVAQIFAEGKQNAVPLMIGSNANEGSILYWNAPHIDMPPVQDLASYREHLSRIFGDKVSAIDALYPIQNEGELHLTGRDMLGDSLFGAPARYAAGHMKNVKQPAYLYFFSRTPPGRAATRLGAYHAAEIPFVFDTHAPVFEITEADKKLTGIMGLYWVNFAKSGDPNIFILPKWTPYSQSDEKYMEFSNTTAKMAPVERGSAYDLLDQAMLNKLAKFPESMPKSGK
ncbi:MAG: carboxylesterase family protein [Pseudomonadota bacterium]